MNTLYPLEWLDTLILHSLNPNKSDLTVLSNIDINVISESVKIEAEKIQIRLKNEIFLLVKKRQIRLQVRKYHSNLIYLLDSSVDHKKNKVFKNNDLAKVLNLVISTVDELLSFVENRFSQYLSLDERVPITYLIVSKKELMLKLSTLEDLQLELEQDRSTIGIVINELSNSIQSSNEKASFRQIMYNRLLLKRLSEASYNDDLNCTFSTLDKILIEMNFNCKKFVDTLIAKLSRNSNNDDDYSEKLNTLLCSYKDFNQLFSNERITFDPMMQNIKTTIDNWFNYEILYYERQIRQIINEQIPTSETSNKSNDKVECILSTDQMALILRASDESRVLKARSMNLVFKTIVPFLSTPFKKDLSYQAVRSKSYNAEDRDKEIAIQTLKKIIEKIKTY
ncbi:hypothetical protein [Flavobacterium sp.]|uniref:hypothetical protein n=1 Tax=Flavobacterium sp. TaxID=239 RepID=UPI0031D30B34